MGLSEHLPDPRFAKSGDVHIAYRVEGEGPFDLVFVPPLTSSIEDYEAYQPGFRDLVRQLTSFARLIQFDKRGTGSSDRVVGAPTLEERMDDVRAVMDAVGSRSAALVGVADGAAMSIVFGERARAFRQSMPPGAFLALRHMNMEIDVRHILPSVTGPTLLMYRPHAADADETGDVLLMTYVRERIPHAETTEASADIEHWSAGLTEPLSDFLPRAWADYQQLHAQPRRVLATVLFTDIVGSTAADRRSYRRVRHRGRQTLGARRQHRRPCRRSGPRG